MTYTNTSACSFQNFMSSSCQLSGLHRLKLFIYRKCPSRGDQCPLWAVICTGFQRATPAVNLQGNASSCKGCRRDPKHTVLWGYSRLRSPMSDVYRDCILQPSNRADPWVFAEHFIIFSQACVRVAESGQHYISAESDFAGELCRHEIRSGY